MNELHYFLFFEGRRAGSIITREHYFHMTEHVTRMERSMQLENGIWYYDTQSLKEVIM